MILIGAGMKKWTGRTTARNGGGGVEMKKTGIGRDQGKGGGREMLRESESEGESICLAVTVKRREYVDLYSLPTPLYTISPGSINHLSLCTIKIPEFCSKSLQRNNSMNPQKDNMMLRFSSKIVKSDISMTTQDSHKSLSDNSKLKDSKSMSPRNKSLQVSSQTPRENSGSPN